MEFYAENSVTQAKPWRAIGGKFGQNIAGPSAFYIPVHTFLGSGMACLSLFELIDIE